MPRAEEAEYRRGRRSKRTRSTFQGVSRCFQATPDQRVPASSDRGECPRGSAGVCGARRGRTIDGPPITAGTSPSYIRLLYLVGQGFAKQQDIGHWVRGVSLGKQRDCAKKRIFKAFFKIVYYCLALPTAAD